jgi:hypothetical protein
MQQGTERAAAGVSCLAGNMNSREADHAPSGVHQEQESALAKEAALGLERREKKTRIWKERENP